MNTFLAPRTENTRTLAEPQRKPLELSLQERLYLGLYFKAVRRNRPALCDYLVRRSRREFAP